MKRYLLTLAILGALAGTTVSALAGTERPIIRPLDGTWDASRLAELWRKGSVIVPDDSAGITKPAATVPDETGPGAGKNASGTARTGVDR